jgi:hypothetical protein
MSGRETCCVGQRVWTGGGHPDMEEKTRRKMAASARTDDSLESFGRSMRRTSVFFAILSSTIGKDGPPAPDDQRLFFRPENALVR